MSNNQLFSQVKNKKAMEWFLHGSWKDGIKPHPDKSIDIDLFYEHYTQHKELWDLAFDFLKNNDLLNIRPGKIYLKGDSLIAIVDEYITKDPENTKYEAHKKYIDLQYLITGEEFIGVTKLMNQGILTPYDETKDIAFYDIPDNNFRIANPGVFFIFFPEDAHRPCVKTGENTPVKKIVFKIISAS